MLQGWLGLWGLCLCEIFPLPVSQKHPEVSGGLLHHRAITINSNYTSSLAAELCKNNKEARKKKNLRKGREALAIQVNFSKLIANTQCSQGPLLEKAPDKEMERTGRLISFYLLK